MLTFKTWELGRVSNHLVQVYKGILSRVRYYNLVIYIKKIKKSKVLMLLGQYRHSRNIIFFARNGIGKISNLKVFIYFLGSANNLEVASSAQQST